MKIGIIGAGTIGAVLVRRLSSLGHTVRVANSRGPETLSDLASETGAEAIDVGDVLKDVDLVILTIPQVAVPQLAGVFRSLPPGVPVIDTGNYHPKVRDGLIVEIEGGMIESRWVQKHLGGPALVKVFNNIHPEPLRDGGRALGAEDRLALPVAGDDVTAKKLVMAVVEELGFTAVDAGGLDDSWRQQPGTPVYTTRLGADATRRGLAEARPERQDKFKADRPEL